MVVSGRSRLPVIISTCFVAVAAIGAFGALAWTTGELALAQINPLFVPIAPLTILLLVLLGASWFLCGVRPQYSWFRIPAGVVGVLVVILTSLTIYHAVMPGSFSLEALMFPSPATVQGYPIARISIVTAVMFLLGGLSLILLVSSSKTRTKTSAALFGIVILSCGVVTSIGYLYQAPLLYGTPIIPVSLPAAIAFLFLGTEVWAAAGRECWPTRNLVGDSVQARLLRTFLPVVALTLVVLQAIDQILPDEYMTPLLGSLELMGGLLVVIVIVARLSSGMGSEIDQGIIERERLQGELQEHSLHLKELVAGRTRELRESEKEYRELFEASPVSLWEEDYSLVKQFVGELRQKGFSDFGAYLANHPEDVAKCAGLVKVINVNKATLNLYDAKSVDEILGGLSGLSNVFTEQSNREFIGQLVALAQGKEYYEGEMENRTLRGETKHCNLICAVVPGYEQSLAKVLVCIVDLTPQKKLETELRAAKERLEYVIASNPVVFVLEKPLPDLSNTFSTFVSESATSVLGFEPKNFLGEPGAEFFNSRLPPGDLAQYLAEMPSLWSDGHHAFEFRFLHSDGAYRWLREEMKVTRDAEGHVLDVVGVCIDVTERKKLEGKLARAERLAVIGETAAMVGHDLRNPLQGIAGAVYLLKQESLTVEERNEMLQVIEKSVHYADAIVKDLLDYSAEIKLKLAEATPKSITRDAIGAVKVPQNVRVQDLSEDQPTLRVDSDRMRRVFVNLIENAIDAMPEGGTLTVSSKKSDGNVEIALTDTGSGMSKKVMEDLWKPLRTTKAKGMGLGLSICRRIVDAHGGSISVESKAGAGTIMTIRIPIPILDVVA